MNALGRRVRADCRGATDLAALLVIVPLAFGVLMLFVYLTRQGVAAEGVSHASHVAAVAAAQQRDPAAAQAAAQRMAASTLAAAATACVGGPAVTVTADRWQPGGVVTVTVTCAVDTGDLAAIGAPARSLTATAQAVIDTYRGYAP